MISNPLLFPDAIACKLATYSGANGLVVESTPTAQGAKFGKKGSSGPQ